MLGALDGRPRQWRGWRQGPRQPWLLLEDEWSEVLAHVRKQFAKGPINLLEAEWSMWSGLQVEPVDREGDVEDRKEQGVEAASF